MLLQSHNAVSCLFPANVCFFQHACMQEGIGEVALFYSRGVLPESVDLENRVKDALEMAGRLSGNSGR